MIQLTRCSARCSVREIECTISRAPNLVMVKPLVLTELVVLKRALIRSFCGFQAVKCSAGNMALGSFEPVVSAREERSKIGRFVAGTVAGILLVVAAVAVVQQSSSVSLVRPPSRLGPCRHRSRTCWGQAPCCRG